MSESFRPNVYICLAEDGSHIVANCITCGEFFHAMGTCNLLLLSSLDPNCVRYHQATRFKYVPVDRIPELIEEDPYVLGDFQWVAVSLPNLCASSVMAVSSSMLKDGSSGNDVRVEPPDAVILM